METKFEFNDCGVCLNPKVIYPLGINEKTYDTYYIAIAHDENNNWGVGTNAVGGRSMGASSPCSIIKREHGKSKEELLEAAIQNLKENAQISINKITDVNNSKEFQKEAKKFLNWEF